MVLLKWHKPAVGVAFMNCKPAELRRNSFCDVIWLKHLCRSTLIRVLVFGGNDDVVFWNVEAPHNGIVESCILNAGCHRKIQCDKRIFSPIKQSCRHAMMLRQCQPVPRIGRVIVNQVKTTALKVLQHFLFGLLDIGQFVSGDLRKQRLVLCLAPIQNEPVPGYVENYILKLPETRYFICFILLFHLIVSANPYKIAYPYYGELTIKL